MDMKSRRSAFYRLIAETAARVAASLGLSSDHADHVGCAIADEIAQEMAGQVLSFPTDASYQLSAREREAIAMRNSGASFAQIAKHFGMTENGVRKLIKRASARATGPDQPDLF